MPMSCPSFSISRDRQYDKAALTTQPGGSIAALASDTIYGGLVERASRSISSGGFSQLDASLPLTAEIESTATNLGSETKKWYEKYRNILILVGRSLSGRSPNRQVDVT